ncbi:MAG: nucleotide excision repair endonuclease, partial [Solirubrobacterales bacterium]
MADHRDIPGGETEEMSRLDSQRKKLPDQPGVYLFKDERDAVLYVGKARSIRKRVAGHFAGKSARGGGEMVSRIASIDFLVTETEAEALL